MVLNCELSPIGLYCGLLTSSFTLGKLIGFKPISSISSKFPVKWVLILLYLLSSISILCFGFTSNFGTSLFLRFLSGFLSNSQFTVRRLLQSLDFQLKDQDSNSSKKALVAYKSGNCIGAVFGGLLINCEYFMPKSSQFVEQKFLLVCLLVFLLKLSGVLLVFSIETKGFILLDLTKSYIELQEKGDSKAGESNTVGKDSEAESTGKQRKEKSDLSHFIQNSVLANSHLASEESVGPEEIKFYSPREGVVKEVASRKLNSARPKVENSFNFPDSVVETKEQERPEGEGKRTHISFIEEELEVIQEVVESNVKRIEEREIKKEKVQSELDFAVRIKVLNGFVLALVVEAIPYSVLMALENSGKLVVGTVQALVVVTGIVGYLAASDKIMQKYSIYAQMIISSVFNFAVLALFPMFEAFSYAGFILIPIWISIIFGIEGYLVFANVLVSDSVTISEREKYLNSTNIYGLSAKILASCLSPALLYILKWHQIAFSLYSFLFLLLLYLLKRSKPIFPAISEFPYRT